MNCDNGTVELRTGKLREHRRDDFLSITTGIEYPTTQKTISRAWSKFLLETFREDDELIGFVQRLCGLALVGGVYENILPFSYGIGANGKTVFWEAVRGAMGDYAMAAPAGLLMQRRFEAHSTEVADLFRKRLVIVSETSDGARLNEGLVKTLTGGEVIRARRMRQDHFEFEPTHTLALISNHRPVVSGRDDGIWRRIRLVPFEAQIPPERQDRRLSEKLREEYPAILWWMVQGCLDWQRGGLQEPDEVKLATDSYKREQDVIGAFIDECCMVGVSYQVKSATLYQEYRKWCEQSGETIQSNRKFKASLVERQFKMKKDYTNFVVGLTLSEG